MLSLLFKGESLQFSKVISFLISSNSEKGFLKMTSDILNIDLYLSLKLI